MAETLGSIPFTQFLRPDGRRASVAIIRPAPVLEKASAIIAAGFRFECEELATGHASLTIADDEGDHAIEVVVNGPGVPEAVDRLVLGFDPSARSIAA